MLIKKMRMNLAMKLVDALFRDDIRRIFFLFILRVCLFVLFVFFLRGANMM